MTRKLEYLDLDSIQPAEVNPKAHDEEMIAASVDRFGVVEPIVRDDRTGRLISGHGRTDDMRARRDAGKEPPDGVTVVKGRWLVPVVTGWASRDDEDARAAVVALNRVGERGGWRRDDLAEMLADLNASERGLAGVGYDRADLDDLLAALEEATREETYSEDGRSGDAAHPESTLDEWAANYRNKQVRSMVLDFPLDDYREVAELAGRARKALSIESNAELLQALLRQWATDHGVAIEPAAAVG